MVAAVAVADSPHRGRRRPPLGRLSRVVAFVVLSTLRRHSSIPRRVRPHLRRRLLILLRLAPAAAVEDSLEPRARSRSPRRLRGSGMAKYSRQDRELSSLLLLGADQRSPREEETRSLAGAIGGNGSGKREGRRRWRKRRKRRYRRGAVLGGDECDEAIAEADRANPDGVGVRVDLAPHSFLHHDGVLSPLPPLFASAINGRRRKRGVWRLGFGNGEKKEEEDGRGIWESSSVKMVSFRFLAAELLELEIYLVEHSRECFILWPK